MKIKPQSESLCNLWVNGPRNKGNTVNKSMIISTSTFKCISFFFFLFKLKFPSNLCILPGRQMLFICKLSEILSHWRFSSEHGFHPSPRSFFFTDYCFPTEAKKVPRRFTVRSVTPGLAVDSFTSLLNFSNYCVYSNTFHFTRNLLLWHRVHRWCKREQKGKTGITIGKALWQSQNWGPWSVIW